MDVPNQNSSPSLSSQKEELLALLLAKQGFAARPADAPAPRGDVANPPLAPVQERLWFLQQLEPDSPVYNEPLAVWLRGPLDVEALERSLNALLARHEILRTSFPAVDGRPQQQIAPSLALALARHDLEHLPAAARLPAAHELLNKSARAPFDIGCAPLLRASLLRLSPDEQLLLLTFHHLIADAWSLGLVLSELAQLYGAAGIDQEAGSPPLALQYADVALWQRAQLQGERLAKLRSYWQQQLAAAPALELPTDFARPSTLSSSGAHASFVLPAGLVGELEALSSNSGVTLFVTLLAAFQLLLSRYTGQTDIVLGTPIAGRTHPAMERLLGCFVNTLALRSDLSGAPAFRALLARVQQVVLAAFEHQELPFDQVVEALRLPRQLGRQPLAPVLFAFQNAPLPPLQVGQLELELLELELGTARADLLLSLAPTRDGLRGTVEYRSDLFQAATITRLCRHLRTLLEGIVANPETPIDRLPLMDAEETRQLLQTWTAIHTFPVEQCLHELFEAQATRRPDAIAVAYQEAQLSYRALNERADRLAHYLRSLGVGPERLVGLYAERSIELVIGLLGILKAGGAYLPLDPDYPPDRIQFMLDDARASLLLTQQQLADRLPASSTQYICLDSDWHRIVQTPDCPASQAPTPDNLAYVIYTSGSTGLPKGAQVTHANVVRLFLATQDRFHFDSRDAWTLFHSIAFDFSVWEYWGALLYGGRLVVVPYLVSRDPLAFHELLAREQVTVLNQTPSAFSQLIQADAQLESSEPPWLRLVIFGGEALDLQSLRPWFERHGDQQPQLVNMYGITETTVHVTYRLLRQADLAAPRSVIGMPIPDLRLALLDQRCRPVPVGVVGEIYVGGAGVVRGYLGRPDLTAERFIPNPFATTDDRRPTTDPNDKVTRRQGDKVTESGEAITPSPLHPFTLSEPSVGGGQWSVVGGRLYRTGDLARYRADGELEYLGRVDQQVKIRGFRIELGEVEAVLAAAAGVGQVVCIPQTDMAGARLVAYVVAQAGATVTVPALRRWAQARLPEYMVPSAFVLLDKLPLTRNGKLDRAALPQPGVARTLDTPFVAPRTPAERILADVWAQTLGLGKVGIDDNYFAIGGDSIRTLQIQARVREKGLHFPLQQIFKAQTIRELAQVLTPAEDIASASQTPPFRLLAEDDRRKLPADVEDAYPLSMLQWGLLFQSEYRPDFPSFREFLSLHLRLPFDQHAFETTLRQLAAQHAILRTSFDLTTFSQPLQLVYRQGDIPFVVEDLRHLSPADQELAINEYMEREKRGGFKAAREPLIRFHLHVRSDETTQWSVYFHNAMFDGWSAGLFFSELFRRYIALCQGDVLPLKPLATSFKDFIALEQQAIHSEASRRYWAEALHGSSATMLPAPAPGRPSSSPRVMEWPVPLPDAVEQRLRELARSLGVPIKSVLLAAHMRVISMLSGQTDVMAGVVLNGRPESPDGDRVLGMFLNTVPLRLNLTGGTWADLVRAAFDAERELLAFRRYPLALLLREREGKPLFESALNFTHFHIYREVEDLVGSGGILDAAESYANDYPMWVHPNIEPYSSRIQKIGLQFYERRLSEEQARQIVGYYARALAALATSPHSRYETCSLFDEAELRRLIVEWNNTATSYPQEPCIHDLFVEHAERAPEQIALLHDSQCMTYGELHRRSNQLAQRLQQLGVRPEVIVAICMDRSAEMVVGLLGILKAGGAYLFLDPEYPQERLAFMLADAQAGLLLTRKALIDRLPAHSAQVLCLDSDWEEISRATAQTPFSGATPDNLAYVMYTSGSTGRPKGVLGTHRATLNCFYWMWQDYPFIGGEVCCQKTSMSFGDSIQELFGPLLKGVPTVLIPDPVLKDPNLFVRLMADTQVSRIVLVPSLLSVLLDAYPDLQSRLPDLKLWIASGEALTVDLARRFQQSMPDSRLLNMYGASEVANDITVYNVRCMDDTLLSLPIGKPVANIQVYLFDRQLHPVPAGVPGELYIGGAGLNRGYFNRPDLTAERFVPCPWSVVSGQLQRTTDNGQRTTDNRLYKTGDLARYQQDGTLEFLGRADHQVKIRGVRIELGEIETVLTSHPSVRASVVMARADGAGDARLVAYVVPRDWRLEIRDSASDNLQSPISNLQQELRGFLRTRLPEYMLPSVFVILDAFPLSPNGKIDRAALPAPDQIRPQLQRTYVGPRTPVEQIIADVWADVLGLERVGVEDHFFEIGGHSLLAMRVIARLHEAFEVELPVRCLFDAPTVAGLVVEIAKAQLQQLDDSMIGVSLTDLGQL